MRALREGLVEHPKRRKELAESCDISVEDYTMRYAISMRDQTNTRIKEFIFRLANGLLYGRHDTYKFGLAQSSSCPLCGESDQRWTHIIYECHKVKELERAVVGDVVEAIYTFTEEPIMVNERVRLWRYAYTQSHLGRQIDANEFKRINEAQKATERTLYERKCKLKKYIKIWGNDT